MRVVFFFLVACLLNASRVFSQTEKLDLENYTPISFKLKTEEEEEKKKDEEEAKKEKKKKKNEYYGIKTRKASAYSGARNKLVWELFNVLKEPGKQELDTYVQEVYWFDPKARKIVNSKKIKPRGVLLHGPYKRMLGETVLAEGIFYKGMKHGRWTTYSRKGVLTDKRKFFRGWAKDSHVTYYNQEKGQMKEVVQIHYKQADGAYYKFFESGQVAVQGFYKFGVKTGIWTEYYEDVKGRRRRKRRINYGKDPFDKRFVPHIEREWSMAGKLIYDVRKKR
ncbi:MAG: hypothetical protein MI784_02855 [Cytophagales bacterium]|nr:hypothetical protein [Cytophagales bacterium]